MKMMKKVDTTWSPTLTYIIGVIATDGNLSPDGRHVNITSKDEALLLDIRNALGLTCQIGKKSRAALQEKKYSVLQIGDKNFYNFLLSIGLTTNKSKTIDKLKICYKFFGDFLRGCIDGDGTITSCSHPESKHKQLRIRLYSASLPFLNWIQTEIKKRLNISGGWIHTRANRSMSALSFGKADSIKILHFIYNNEESIYLDRKWQIGKTFMGK